MSDFVWNAAQYEAANTGHPPVTDHHQVGGDDGGDPHPFVSRVPTNAVRLALHSDAISTVNRLVADALTLRMHRLVHFRNVNQRHSKFDPGGSRGRNVVCVYDM